MKPSGLHSPIEISQIPKDLPDNSYEIIIREINSGNKLLFLQNQSGTPSETVFIADFLLPFLNEHEEAEFHYEKGSANGFESCLVCSGNDGCTLIYAGRINLNNCRL